MICEVTFARCRVTTGTLSARLRIVIDATQQPHETIIAVEVGNVVEKVSRPAVEVFSCHVVLKPPDAVTYGDEVGDVHLAVLEYVLSDVTQLVSAHKLQAAFIILGGFRRLAAVSEKLIPFMTAVYVIGCLVMILLHIRLLPEVIASIFRFALGPKAVLGGAAGTAVQLAFNTIKNGCKRGVFSNEAGLGSSVMVHSNTCAREPVRQGLWGIAEVFLDTMVVCTMTAFVVLGSGAIDLKTGLVAEGTNDATLVAKAFGAALGKPGEWFVVLSITLFAFTTVMGWSYYGAKVAEYLFGVVWAKVYRVIFILLIVFGAVMESNLAWDISDTFNGLMMIPNLIGVLMQIPLIMKLTRNYIDRRLKGKEVEPMLSFDRDIQRDAERAVNKGMD